jgi:arylsulfatase A-like enzyme
MRSYVGILALMTFFSSWSMHAAAQSADPARPNVVLIMTDDMGWADIGSYGAPDIRTPNIDSLARDAVKLTDFYSNGVLCTPTRAGLMSGRYQQRYGLEIALPNEGAPEADRGLPATGRTLPRVGGGHPGPGPYSVAGKN